MDDYCLVDAYGNTSNSSSISSAIRSAIRNIKKAKHSRHHIAAVIIKSNNIISIGWNSNHIHAEESAINRAWRSAAKIVGATIIVIRVRKDGTYGLAYPCSSCMGKIIATGIKKIIYSDNSSTFQTIKIGKSISVTAVDIRTKAMIWNGQFSNPILARYKYITAEA